MAKEDKKIKISKNFGPNFTLLQNKILNGPYVPMLKCKENQKCRAIIVHSCDFLYTELHDVSL